VVQVLQRYFSGGWFGEDRDGHPVWYEDNHIDWQGEGRERGEGGEERGGGGFDERPQRSNVSH